MYLTLSEGCDLHSGHARSRIVSPHLKEEIPMASPKTIAPDAVALLKADHKQVKGWFAQFEKSRSAKIKQKLAADICKALTVHTEIEEEMFYPAFLAATRDKDMHH